MTHQVPDQTARSPVGSVRRRLRTAGPGVAAAVVVAGLALSIAAVLPFDVGAVMLALVGGLLIGNARRLPSSWQAGLDVSATRILRIGVALLGARLTLTDIGGIGLTSIGMIVSCMAAALLCVAVAGRLAGIPWRLAVLIGAGTAVCGNSAIMASAPVIRAEEREVTYAVGTITIFGTSALLLFPLIARAADVPSEVFGLWAGLAINDTSQVVAAGAAHSPVALDTATVVKLVRNAMLAPFLVMLSWWMRHRSREQPAVVPRGVRVAVPGFVVAFMGLVVLRTVGVIRSPVDDLLAETATILITIAIAAVGLKTRLAQLGGLGARPLLVGLVVAAVVAVLAFVLASAT